MRAVFLTAAMLFAAVTYGHSQDPRPGTGSANDDSPINTEDTVTTSTAAAPERNTESKPAAEIPNKASEKGSINKMRARLPVPYIRPGAESRFKNYLHAAFGPESLVRYAATAGLLTLRDSPKEWGAKPDGFTRRFVNVAAKNAIRTTTTFGLDELLKVDSTFYLSRDRSVAARLRNSVFSAVTARNRRGHRVIGVPRLAGSFASEVISSTGWYPSRYDQDHGLKGGAISIGITAGINLFREFIWKR